MSYNVLNGKWFIIYSTFPMWIKGDKRNPSLNYSLDEKRNIRIHDKVEYTRKGKLKKIIGFDYFSIDPQEFVWRGKGLLYLLKSRWRIEFISEDNIWIIISFKKTLFTKSGYDIICKIQNPNETVLKKMKHKFDERFVNIDITRIS